MASTSMSSRRWTGDLGSLRRMPWAAYWGLCVLLTAYLVSLLLRTPDQSSTLFDGWGVAVFEVTASGLCLWRAFTVRRGRAVPLLLGLAILSWSIGDFFLTGESLNNANVPTPSLADAFYLTFYPLAYTSLVLLLRREARPQMRSLWLDGIIAGLGSAALCATFIFGTLVRAVGDTPLGAATNLAYPVGDLLLLALVVGGSAILPGRRQKSWILLAAACAINAVGDTFNLLNASSQVAFVFNGIAWPAAILALSAAMWMQPGHAPARTTQEAPGFLLPGLGALAGMAVLFLGSQHHVDQAALALAMATLVTAGLRLSLSVRRLRAITRERHRQSVTDELTGLGNRRHLYHLLDGYFASVQRADTPPPRLAFLYIDLDRFKEVNDSFGHAAGDDLLRQVGPRLRGLLRSSDTLVRVGGDELGVILHDTDPVDAATIARRLRGRLEEPFILGSVRIHISASIGIAFAPTDATDTAGLLRCADLAMYRAKTGDAAVRVYQQDIDDAGNRLQLVEELRTAVSERQFVLHFQPQVDLQTGEVAAVEALLRWPHPRLGVVPPLEFLPLAEEAGLMPALTAVVLDQALDQCARWRRSGRQVAVSVNVSATNLVDPGFIELVQGLLNGHALPPSSLVLEITETTVLRDFERCKQVIEDLRGLGLDVSIDDFGAGFTSLAYLGSLAVRELKLDRTFITHLAAEERGRDLALVRATIDLGHALGLRVVAEGIEDGATFDLLARAGCDLAQGYFISRPLPATQLLLEEDSGTLARSGVA